MDGPQARLALVVALLISPTIAGCDPVGASTPAAPIAAPGAFVPPAPPLPPAKPWQVATVPKASVTPAATSTSKTSTATSSTPATTSSSVPLGPCYPLYGPGTEVPVNVVPLTGAVQLSWYHNGDLATVAYWVGVQADSADPRKPSPVRWIRIAPPTGCRDVTATVPGVVKGTGYTLWLDMESSTPETRSGVTRRTVHTVYNVVSG
jgi:hypothetical protein